MSVSNINITVLTESLMANYSQLSLDPNVPTHIPNSYLHVIISSPKHLESAGNGSLLTLNVVQGNVAGFVASENVVQFRIKSESGNYDEPVILYNIKKYSGDSIFKLPVNFKSYQNVRTVVPKSFNHFAVKYVNQDFWFCQGHLNKYGTAVYDLQCALYTGDLSLYGYFQSSHEITISKL